MQQLKFIDVYCKKNNMIEIQEKMRDYKIIFFCEIEHSYDEFYPLHLTFSKRGIELNFKTNSNSILKKSKEIIETVIQCFNSL